MNKHLISLLLSLFFATTIIMLKHYEVLPQSVQMGLAYYKFDSLSHLLIAIFFATLIIWGACYLFLREQSYIISTICPNCEFASNVSKVEHTLGKCPKCGTDMIKLKGFYNKNKPIHND